MYFDDGNVDGVQVLDSSWIQKSFSNYTESSNDFRSLDAYAEVGYGLCWWIFDHDTEKIYSARGKGGQHIMVIPDKKIVVVILQDWNPLRKNSQIEDKLMAEFLGILFGPMDVNFANARDL